MGQGARVRYYDVDLHGYAVVCVCVFLCHACMCVCVHVEDSFPLLCTTQPQTLTPATHTHTHAHTSLANYALRSCICDTELLTHIYAHISFFWRSKRSLDSDSTSFPCISCPSYVSRTRFSLALAHVVHIYQ